MKLSIVNFNKDWEPFCHALYRADLLANLSFATAEAREANMPSLIREVHETFLTQDLDYWHQKLEDADVPHAAIPTYEEAANDIQKVANDIIVPLDHPEHGKMRTINSPFEVSGAVKIKPGAAPKLGQHTKEVLKAAGFSEGSIEEWLSNGVIEQSI